MESKLFNLNLKWKYIIHYTHVQNTWLISINDARFQWTKFVNLPKSTFLGLDESDIEAILSLFASE